MSDSDDDSLQNNVFKFQNNNTTICATGPNVNNTNITGLSFRNNVLTSTMHMPVNFEHQRNGGYNFDQKSMYCRREASPMSLRSVPNYGRPTFNHSSYQNGRNFPRSMYSGRGGSPMSVRSIDSTASVSAADIVFAFKNIKFNKYDLQIIKHAYNKLIKTRQRKRIEKRRNLKLFLKGTRRKSGGDSGEQGSDSSISSDDCRSVRTTICKENVPGFKQMRDLSDSGTCMRGTTNNFIDISHFSTNTNKYDNPIFTDRTENIKQNTMRNMMSVSSNISNVVSNERFKNSMQTQDPNTTTMKIQNASAMTQKERFKKGFLLPSQRFNKTIAGQNHINKNDRKTKTYGKNKVVPLKPSEVESGSDQEDIFKGFSINEQNVQRKRSLEDNGCSYSNKKRNNSISPKQLQNSVTPCNSIPNEKTNDFIFAKPKMPFKKGNTKKSFVPEKLLAKSHVPLITEEIDFGLTQKSKPTSIENENAKDIEDCTQSDILHSNSDISMRPSFIKRKLFTQKLDMAECKNASSDSLGVNSPQNIYSASIRERSKARKLVTSQSCLSREVLGEDNNVLDLIHKIVPADQINITNVANKTEPSNSKSNNIDTTNKWDVTAVIANCDNQDISDTYTDEEIFNVIQNKDSDKHKKSAQLLKEVKQCEVVVSKLSSHLLDKPLKNNNKDPGHNKSVDKETSKKSVTDCVKSFWDTDFESDMEFNVAPSRRTNMQQNQEIALQQRNNTLGDKHNQINKKPPISKGTILTVRNCHKDARLNNSLKSHKSPITSDKKDIEINKPKSVVQGLDNTKMGKNKKEANSTSQMGKKKVATKKTAPGNKTNELPGRKPKTKQCVECTLEKTTTLKSEDNKNSATNQDNKNTTGKVTKSSQNNKPKTQKESVNVRIQPKRKSKEKSFIHSPKPRKILSNNVAPNKIPKNKASREVVANNTSIGSISAMITRSREKLSFNSSGGDYSSMDVSNLSNRSLRLRQRVQRNIH